MVCYANCIGVSLIMINFIHEGSFILTCCLILSVFLKSCECVCAAGLPHSTLS